MNLHFIVFLVFVNAFFIGEAAISKFSFRQLFYFQENGLINLLLPKFPVIYPFLSHIFYILLSEKSNLEPECDCRDAGGCIISSAPPYGYKCECKLSWRGCDGAPKKCDDSDVGTPGCKGCFGEECCSGNCGGYFFG